MASKVSGYVEWIAENSPPENGYLINSKLYKFLPSPEFNGRRIELIKAINIKATVRFHQQYIREVNLLDPQFTEEIRWTWVSQNREQVQAYLDMLSEEPEGKKKVPKHAKNDKAHEEGKSATVVSPGVSTTEESDSVAEDDTDRLAVE